MLLFVFIFIFIEIDVSYAFCLYICNKFTAYFANSVLEFAALINVYLDDQQQKTMR